MIPPTHPRYESLRIRHMLTAGFEAGAVAVAGLAAHGRGEAFDYMLGEKSTPMSRRACTAAAAALLISAKPVISVNGNMAALCPDDTVRLARACGAKLEANLFYDDIRRRRVISGMLHKSGAVEVLGVDEKRVKMSGLDSARRMVSPEGIMVADTVLVSMEDGDRTQALVAAGKRVISVDLNPASRTAKAAHITIVDNVVRAIPMLVEYCSQMASRDVESLRRTMQLFCNDTNLAESSAHMARNFGGGDNA